MRLFLLALLILSFSCVHAQTKLSFSKAQMYADFDTLIANIVSVSPHLAVKKDLFGYDPLQRMKSLRSGIDTIRSDFSFYLLLRRVFNASQDMHTSLVGVYPEQMRVADRAFGMYMPVTYVEGEYVIRESFHVGKDTIYTGSKIVEINDTDIDRYVVQHLQDRYFSYDVKRKKFYSAGFFKNLETLFQEQAKFKFKGLDGKEKSIFIRVRDRFNYLRNIPTPQDTTKIEHWPDKQTLYIRLAEMDVKKLPYLISELERYRDYRNLFDRMIIDIRNNGGGQDTVWQTLYTHVLANAVTYSLKMDVLNPEVAASINPQWEKETNPLLKKFNLCTVVNKTETLEPAARSIRFNGKIIVLAENIYSSAGSSMVIANADPKDNIISVGRRTGFVLGVGLSPLNFQLPHSKFSYRIAPSINVTNVKKMSDLMQDYYEVEVPYSLEEFRNIEKHHFSNEYLLSSDPFVRKALAL